jgi:hypothetical protein
MQLRPRLDHHGDADRPGVTTAKQARRARKKQHRPTPRPDHDVMLVAVICDECGRHQFNRQAPMRGTPSPIAGCIPHSLIETIADTVAGCRGCGHPYGRYL